MSAGVSGRREPTGWSRRSRLAVFDPEDMGLSKHGVAQNLTSHLVMTNIAMENPL